MITRLSKQYASVRASKAVMRITFSRHIYSVKIERFVRACWPSLRKRKKRFHFGRRKRLNLSENRNNSHDHAPSVAYIGDLPGSLYFSYLRLSRPDFPKTAGLNPVTKHRAHGRR